MPVEPKVLFGEPAPEPLPLDKQHWFVEYILAWLDANRRLQECDFLQAHQCLAGLGQHPANSQILLTRTTA